MKNTDSKSPGVVLLQIHYQPDTPPVFIPVERGKNNLWLLFTGNSKDIFIQKKEV